MALLSNVVFQATQGRDPLKYLGVTSDDGPNKNYVSYTTDAVLNKNAKLKVENASDGLVHILSCSTNKYFVRSSLPNENWIVAQGYEPVTDRTSRSCSLFRMDLVGDEMVTLYHVQSGNMVGIPSTESDRRMFWTLDPAATVAVSRAIDHDEFVELPRYVAFKGSNGLFYRNNYYDDKGKKHHAHFSANDIGDPHIVCETHYTDDGLLRVKPVALNKEASKDMFWSERKELISWSVDSPSDSNQIFAPIKIHDNVVALRSLGNNKLCQRADYRHRIRNKKDRLVASANGAVTDTHLEVVEPFLRRSVYSVEFDLDNARIYGLTLLYTDEHVWKNPTNENQSGTADGRIMTNESKTYSNTISVSASVSAAFEVGIPFIAKGEISVSATASYAFQWGKTVTNEQQVGHAFQVAVLPQRKTRARGTATRGLCDVPFTYVQKDFPANGGPPIITRLSNGVFKGANAYGFESEVWYEDLTSEELSKDEVEFYIIPAKAPTDQLQSLVKTSTARRSSL